MRSSHYVFVCPNIVQNGGSMARAYSIAATAAATATATIPPWTWSAPTPLLESGASVVAAADELLEVRVVRELVSLSVVELPVSDADEESVMVDDESSVVLLSVAVAVAVRVVAPDEAGREAVPSAPATVNAGAKLKFCGSSSSVIRRVYSLPAATTSAGIVKDAEPAAAGTLEARTMPLPANWSVPAYCRRIVTVPSDGFAHVMVVG